MIRPGSPSRSLLAVIWCVLVGAGYFMAQFSAFTGSPIKVTDPVQLHLRRLYFAFLVVAALLVVYDGWHARRCMNGNEPETPLTKPGS